MDTGCYECNLYDWYAIVKQLYIPTFDPVQNWELSLFSLTFLQTRVVLNNITVQTQQF